MKIHEIQSQPSDELAVALGEFESEFRYPLGDDSWFRISHGDDYTRFFRAIGEARCFVATNGSGVIGTITSTICRLRKPYGSFHRGGYISDLKIRPWATGRTLLRLLHAASDWTLTAPTPSFCVVMDGTTRSPINYTGRMGIPPFVEVAKTMVLRIPSESPEAASKQQTLIDVHDCDTSQARRVYERLTVDCYATEGGKSVIRSVITPIGLIASGENGSGVLEDTRRCKTLFRSDGIEMVSAHLSCFAYSSIESGVEIILAALQHCRKLGIPALFVCVRCEDVLPILQTARLDSEQTVRAPATVFGACLEGSGQWSINSSEI